jgi:hypothetical protein
MLERSVCHATIKNFGSVSLLFHIEACYHRQILSTTTDNFFMCPKMTFGNMAANPSLRASHPDACKNPRAEDVAPFATAVYFYKS